MHKQKLLVLCNLSGLYSAFRDKYPNIKIRLSKFCTPIPKWCVLAWSSGTHSFCVCSTHQNAVLLVDAIDWECTYKYPIKKVVCDPDSKLCMMHHCESCPGSAALKKFLDDELSHLDVDSEIHYCQWQKTDRAALATLTTTFKEYKELLIESINNLTQHLYLVKAQARYMKLKKESLSLGANEVMVLVDFAENQQYLIQDEIQSFHWSKEYCTLHPLVIYCKDAETSSIIPSVSFQVTTHATPVLFTRFRHYWWNPWSRGSRTSQRSITFLLVVVGNIKISRSSLIYVPIKRTFPSKQSGFSLQLATGNHRVMKLVVWWNTMLQNEVCRDHSTTKFWTIVWC